MMTAAIKREIQENLRRSGIHYDRIDVINEKQFTLTIFESHSMKRFILQTRTGANPQQTTDVRKVIAQVERAYPCRKLSFYQRTLYNSMPPKFEFVVRFNILNKPSFPADDVHNLEINYKDLGGKK